MTTEEYESKIAWLEAENSTLKALAWNRLNEITKLKLELSDIRGKHSCLVSVFDHLNGSITELTKALTS